MEFQSSVSVLVFILLLLLWLAKNYKQKTNAKSLAHNLPPGPWKLPIIGNLHQLARASSSPHHSLWKLAQKYGPLMHLQFGEVSAVVVSSPKIAKEVMKTHDLAFAQRPELFSTKIITYESTDIAFAPYGDYWRQMKKICILELLSAKRVQSFSFIREDEVSKLIELIQLSSGSPINLSTQLFTLMSTIVSRAAFGDVSKQDRGKFVSLVKEAEKLIAGFNLADLFPSMKLIHHLSGMKAKLERIQKESDNILENIICKHQEKRMRAKEREENIIDVLLQIQQSGRLDIPITTNNIKAVILDLFAAGTDTSATTLEWIMAEMMRNPRVREKAQAEVREAFKGKKTIQETDLEELNYLKLIIKETMRLHPPLPLLLPRECRESCNVNGYDIPIKTHVVINAWALARDPEHWYEAENFMPERFQGTCIDFKGNNFEYIPFGAGRRICPGILFGLTNIELPLAKLLYHFDWELPNGMKAKDLDMAESFGIVVGKKNNLYLIPTPYSSSVHDNIN